MASYEEIKEIAEKTFGINTIFPYQWLVISNILDIEARCENAEIGIKGRCIEKETDDYLNKQIVLFPTGAGKSLCFQLPSLFLKKPTLVIYPLLALMRDQYNKLKTIINTVIFIGGQTKSEREEAYNGLKTANIIIANPEVLGNKEVLEKIKMRGISHLAIDEAHCVSEWGETFRSQYLSISSIIKELKPNIITAFTATASPIVLERMKKIIFEGQAHVIASSLDRPNIFFSVRHCCVKEPALLEEIEKNEKPLVVFCSSRKKTETISRLIQNSFQNLEVRFYHAGLEKKEKEEVELWFNNAEKAVLVATCAWGMGVDKKNVRTVIHFDCPSTIEAYIQEAGRGGRDRKPSSALLLWSDEDKKRFSLFGEKEKARASIMVLFAESGVCRRKVLLQALAFKKDEELPFCTSCDICNGSAKLEVNEVFSILNYIKNRKVRKASLVAKIEKMNKYWNLQNANNCVFYLEEKKFLVKDGFLWHGKLKVNKDMIKTNLRLSQSLCKPPN
ncbi:MAG: RecQ family ATP-dependent DNA helicase [Treponema sp.]